MAILVAWRGAGPSAGRNSNAPMPREPVRSRRAAWALEVHGETGMLRGPNNTRRRLALTGELDSVRGLAESLRSQAHEAANRLHSVVSLIELGREHLDEERIAWDAFLRVPSADPAQWDPASVKTSQLRRPLFRQRRWVAARASRDCRVRRYLRRMGRLASMVGFRSKNVILCRNGCGLGHSGTNCWPPVNC